MHSWSCQHSLAQQLSVQHVLVVMRKPHSAPPRVSAQHATISRLDLLVSLSQAWLALLHAQLRLVPLPPTAGLGRSCTDQFPYSSWLPVAAYVSMGPQSARQMARVCATPKALVAGRPAVASVTAVASVAAAAGCCRASNTPCL
jgi:hypothetical protein